MAKIALITDTHAGVRNDNPAFQSYQKKCYEWFFDYLYDFKITNIIHLGDIYDRRKHVNFMSAKRLREDFLEPIQRAGIHTHIIVGNHDMYYKDTHEVNALDEIVGDRYSFINIVSTPKVINIDGLDIQLLPWITQSNYMESMNAIKNPKASIVMGHLELNGFKMYKGSIISHGMDSKLFENFDTVYSGHYHHRSTIGNVTYIGAFGEYTWQDFDDDRGFNILDTETRNLEFIKNPHKMFNVIKYNDIDEPNILEKIRQTDFSKYKDTYVKIVIINKINPQGLDLLVDAIYSEGPIDISIMEDSSILNTEDDEDEFEEVENTTTLLSKYIDNLSLNIENNKLKKFMIDVYQEALNEENV